MGLATTIRQWQSKWVQTHEFLALGPEQREVLARDIGLPHDVLAHLMAHRPDAAAELSRLVEVLSLDAKQIGRTHAPLMCDISVTCSGCAAAARCRRDLDRGRSASTRREYCPNTVTLRELQGHRSRRD